MKRVDGREKEKGKRKKKGFLMDVSNSMCRVTHEHAPSSLFVYMCPELAASDNQ